MPTQAVDLAIAEETSRIVTLVLGGGRGSRLYPLTLERAKPAVPLGGRYRIVDIPLSNCIHSGLKRIYVLTQFNSASLHRHINNTYKFDAFSGGFVEILAAEQTIEETAWFQGTADAVRKHLREINHLQASHYLILSGDQLYTMDYRHMLATHLRADADITVAVLPVTREAAKGFGVLRVNEEGRIVEFVEKPTENAVLDRLIAPKDVVATFDMKEPGRDYLASMGLYLFKPKVLEEILEKELDWIDFGRDVIPKSLSRARVQAHPFSGYWEDIGTVRSYYETSLQMASSNPPFEFLVQGRPTYSRARYLPGTHIVEAKISEAVICEGCRIAPSTIANSIIGIRTIVQPGATILRSVILGADYYEDERNEVKPVPIGIGEGSHVENAIVDKNARIGKNVYIKGATSMPDSNGPGYAVREGIVIVLKNAIIPDGTRIG